ncbi:MAG: SDR family oxidoreductase [Bacteroidetes bacterium]|nr:SDR family oxidoreductase [Bacteroidota bacterium]MCW5894927.1 SDR family oxidoreductase [Bacteroidota bacterium]
MQIFKDKVALVTGSTGEGMGRSIAFTFAREGAKVVLNYGTGHPNNAHAAEKVLQELRALGGKGYAFKADMREEDEVQAMIEGIITLYGKIDFLVCNHGGDYVPTDITDIERDHWRSVVKAEIDGLFYCIKHTLPHMRREHSGRIVAVTLAGVDHTERPPYDYNLGKSARNALIKSLAKSEIENGITCNIIAPGHIPHATLRQAVDSTKQAAAWKRRVHAQPQDVAEAVHYLCSEGARFVTGSVIELAGGSPIAAG